jgi:hypothetical protein
MTHAKQAWRLMAASLVAVSASAQAPAAPAAPAAVAQAPSICGNQPLCYEAPDFAATITDFRTSQQGRIIDIGVRFTNKTNNLLVLGYTNGSGVATDERGNRYVVWGGNGVRGMGLVNGQSVDPKFQVRQGGYGDARFELALQGYPQVIGFNFELDLSVNEVNAYQGNQFTVGSEFPLTWKGLANGAAGAAPGAVAYAGGNGAAGGAAGGLTSIPCQNSSVQNVANGANTAAANVSSAVSSIGSLFGRKQKQQQQDASASGATVPCTPATGTTPATTTTTSTGAVATTPAATPAATPATTAKPTTAPATTTRPAATPATTAKPAATPPAAATATPPKKVTPPVVTTPPTTPAPAKP